MGYHNKGFSTKRYRDYADKRDQNANTETCVEVEKATLAQQGTAENQSGLHMALIASK